MLRRHHGLLQPRQQRRPAATMRLGVFRPPGRGPFPVLTYLAGLTCTEETFLIKAGAQRYAAEAGIMLVAPDTSPRGHDVPGEADAWDFGVGAGFYLDATQEPWAAHWRMETYVTSELPALVAAQLPGRRRSPGHLRPLDGRPRRADPGAAPPGRYALGLGLRPHLRAHPVPLGREGVHRLSRRRPRRVGASTTPRELLRTRGPAAAAAPGRPGARATSSWPSSSSPSCWRRPPRPPASRLTLRRHAGLRPLATGSSRPSWPTTWPTTPRR